jgi:hypothetical protein
MTIYTHGQWCQHLFAVNSLDKAHYPCMAQNRCVAGKVVPIEWSPKIVPIEWSDDE